MNIELGNWKVFRLVGQSERENVRAGLLQVAALNPLHIEEQLNGAFAAAEKLKLRLRIFINTEKIGQEKMQHILWQVWKNRVEHDLMEIKTIDEPATLSKVDLVLKPLPEAATDSSVISRSIMQLWNSTGGRGGILSARGAFYSTKEIKNQFSDFCYSHNELLN